MTDTHGHAWQTRSFHLTSEGAVSYQRCGCGSWRVVLAPGHVLASRIGTQTTGTQSRAVTP